MISRLNQSIKGDGGVRRQTGATLMEMMISLALSVVVTTSMVVLMGNSMGSATRIIQMSQLTDELRNTMSLLTRDVRRANYNPYALYCYANADCGVSDDTVRVNAIADLNTSDNAGNTCVVFFLEREVEDPDAALGDIEGGAFRHATSGPVGVIEMWTGDGAPPVDCTGNEWVEVTDPGIVDITEFTVLHADDETDSFTETIERSDGSTLLTMRLRQVRVQLEGRLILDNSITRRIEDIIQVRNNFIEAS